MLDEFGDPCDVQWRFNLGMEYTDAPTQPEPVSWDTMRCPFCGTTLPLNAQACTNCDWTLEATKPAEPKASDAMAILLSMIPGLGHIYKGHRLIGMVLLFLVTPIAIVFGFLAAIASAPGGQARHQKIAEMFNQIPRQTRKIGPLRDRIAWQYVSDFEDVFGWELLQVGAWGAGHDLLCSSRTRRPPS